MSKESEDFLRREHDKIFGARLRSQDPYGVEHTRLKDAVVAAAKVWAEAAWHTEDRENPYDELVGAVKALIKFERENNL